MPTISTLTVDLTANTSKLDTSLATSVRTIKGHASAIQDSIDSIKSAFEAFGVGLGIGEITSFIEETIRSGAELKSLSSQLGVTTEQFQVLKFAAGEAGIAQDSMDTAITHLTRSIGDAAIGSKPAIDAFNRIGVGILGAGGQVRPTVDVLQDLAKRLADIPDPATRAATETALFGRSGQDLDLLLHNLSGGLGDAYAGMQKFVGQVGDDSIDKLAKMNTQIDEMKDHIHNLAIEALAATADIVNFFASGGGHLPPGTQRPVPGETPAQRLARQTGAAGAETGHEFGGGDLSPPNVGSTVNPPPSGASDQQQKVIDNLKQEAEQLQRSADAQELYTALKQAGVTAESQAGQAIAVYVDRIQQEKAELKEIKDAQDQWNKDVAAAKSIHDSVRSSQEKLNDAVAEATRLQQEGLSSQEDVNRVAEDYNNLMQEAAQIHTQNMTLQEQTNQGLATADELYRKGLLSATDYEREVKRLNEADDGLSHSFDSLATSFGNAASGASDWSSVTSAAISDVIQWVEQLAKSMLGLNGSGSGGGFNLSSVFGGFGDSISAFFGLDGLGGSTLGGAPGQFAGGGRPPVGQPSIVGEAGPELFVPDMAGTVLPHDVLNSLSSDNGGGGNIIINAQGADAAGLARVERAVESLNRNLERRALAAVGDARKRGGSFALSFAG